MDDDDGGKKNKKNPSQPRILKTARKPIGNPHSLNTFICHFVADSVTALQ